VVDTRTFAWSPAGELLQRGFTKQGTGVGDMFDYDNHHRLVGAKLGVSALGGSYSSTSADREVAYALEPGQSRDSVTETLAGGSPSLTDYSNEAASPRYSAVGQIAPIYDGEGNLTFDGHFIYVYDFKNRLSEVYELVPADPETATAMQTFGGVNATPETLERGKSELHRRFGGDVGLALSATRSARTSSILYGSVPSTRSMTSQQTAEFEIVLIAAYGYDPFNRRIVRVVPGEGLNVRYAYDGWREVEELEPVNVEGVMVAQARKVMVWGARFSEILSYHRWEDQGSGQWDWTSYMVSQDEQGSVTWLHRADGSEVEAVEYDPYGKRVVFPAAGGSQGQSTVGFDVSYTSHRIDHETGLLYARNRYLHTAWGRFITLDPLGAWADGGNFGNGYGYVGNMPTMASDPLGLLSVFKDEAMGGASVDGSGALDSGSGPPVDNSGLILNTAGSDGATGADGQGDGDDDPCKGGGTTVTIPIPGGLDRGWTLTLTGRSTASNASARKPASPRMIAWRVELRCRSRSSIGCTSGWSNSSPGSSPRVRSGKRSATSSSTRSRSAVSSRTAGSRSTTTDANGPCDRWPSAGRTGCSPAVRPVVGGPPRCTP
jgi:RHS repeat-associated protein